MADSRQGSLAPQKVEIYAQQKEIRKPRLKSNKIGILKVYIQEKDWIFMFTLLTIELQSRSVIAWKISKQSQFPLHLGLKVTRFKSWKSTFKKKLLNFHVFIANNRIWIWIFVGFHKYLPSLLFVQKRNHYRIKDLHMYYIMVCTDKKSPFTWKNTAESLFS